MDGSYTCERATLLREAWLSRVRACSCVLKTVVFGAQFEQDDEARAVLLSTAPAMLARYDSQRRDDIQLDDELMSVRTQLAHTT